MRCRVMMNQAGVRRVEYANVGNHRRAPHHPGRCQCLIYRPYIEVMSVEKNHRCQVISAGGECGTASSAGIVQRFEDAQQDGSGLQVAAISRAVAAEKHKAKTSQNSI